MTISNELDKYWRLDTYDDTKKSQVFERVKAIGYMRARKTFPKSCLVALLQQHDRGFICYDKFSQLELQQFARNRKLPRHGHHRDGFHTTGFEIRRLLISDLEKSDRQCTFPRFLELPAELRNLIYGYYVAGFPDTLRLPIKPPLSRTCKLLRQEVLPVFYNNIEFQIELKPDSNSPRRFAETINTQLFLLHLATADAACIRRLKLVVIRHRPRPLHAGCEVQKTFYINLGSSKDGPRVTYRDGGPYHRRWWDAQSRQSLLRGIERLVEGLDMRDGKRVFKLEDIHGLRRVVEEASNDSCSFY